MTTELSPRRRTTEGGARGPLSVPVPRLEVLVERENGAATHRRIVIENDRLRVGSHESNDVRLADPQVSRFHCSVSRGEHDWELCDTGSLNGTRLDGVSVRDADLPRAECTVELGNSRLRLRGMRPRATRDLPDWTSFGELHGESAAMRATFVTLDRASRSDSTVLIEGESGTGKELAASEIVRRGRRANAPFVIVDCGSMPSNLAPSELFGHSRGAFTGADAARTGAFEAAHGGTIFLDEVGEMPLDMQPQLLRALESRQIRRVGENVVRNVDVRVIAATNRRLEREVNQGRFREDLYYRLSVVSVRMPSLRQRLDDIPALVEVLVKKMDAEPALDLFTREVHARMQQHDWPGNVRELRNFVERAVVLDSAPDYQPASHHAGASGRGSERVDLDVPFRRAKEKLVETFERRYLSELLEWSGGNVSQAARRSRIDRIHLHRLLQRYGLRRTSSGG